MMVVAVATLAVSACGSNGPSGSGANQGVQQDADPKDSPETPWKREPGQPVTVYYENGGVSDRYWNAVVKAAEIWSESPLIRAMAVAKCPSGGNCVGVVQKKRAASQPRTDGEFSGDDGKKFRKGGTITLYSKLLDKTTDNGALATIVHEMGHSLGLVHRKNPDDVMNSVTNDNTNPHPDQIDFQNLIAIYGAMP
jgi:hypothetical protein